MRLKNIFKTIGNVFMAVLEGKLLTRLHVDDKFPHIIYTCMLLWAAIWIGMQAEKAMVRVEKNKDIVNELRIEHTQMKVKMTSLYSVTTIEKMLAERGSKLKYPSEPAKRTDK